jgi:hypothetical protein
MTEGFCNFGLQKPFDTCYLQTIDRVQTIVTASKSGEFQPQGIAEDYDLTLHQVREALAFNSAHTQEIDLAIQQEEKLDEERDQAQVAS